MKRDVQDYVTKCEICQKIKPINYKPHGLLMPLPIPSQVWQDITMDFITDLPLVEAKSVILVVVDRLTKYAHLIPLPRKFNATMVADVFVREVIKLHGIPASIVSDKDKVFTSHFWKEIHRLSGTKLKYSSAYHPETDGQSEVTNRVLKMYLRSYCFQTPRLWLKLLPWAELWYNSSHHSSINMSPFKALYGRKTYEYITSLQEGRYYYRCS